MLTQDVDKETGPNSLREELGEVNMEHFLRYFGLLVQESHHFLRRAADGEPSVVSLRDVARCVKLFTWFRHFLTEKSALREPGEPSPEVMSGANLSVKAFLLALAHCYYFRLQEGSLRGGDGMEGTDPNPNPNCDHSPDRNPNPDLKVGIGRPIVV